MYLNKLTTSAKIKGKGNNNYKKHAKNLIQQFPTPKVTHGWSPATFATDVFLPISLTWL